MVKSCIEGLEALEARRGTLNCLMCNGTGKAECEACRGKGKVGGFLGMGGRKCPVCEGAINVRCSVCNGTGKNEPQPQLVPQERTRQAEVAAAPVQSHTTSALPHGNPSTASTGTVERLIEHLRDPRRELSESPESQRLVAMGEEAVPVLILHLRVSSYIPSILGKIGSKAATKPLCDLLDEPGGFERDGSGSYPGYRAEVAARALGAIGDINAVSALESVSRSTTYGEVLNAAMDAIAKIKKVGKYSNETNDYRGLSKYDQMDLVESQDTPADVLEQIANSSHVEVVMLVAKNPATPGDILRGINKRFSVPGKKMYYHFVQNPSCPRDILDEIVRDCENEYTVSLARKHSNFR